MPSAEVVRKVLSILGMARRAGVVVIGQDNVLAKLKRGERLFMITTGDCSGALLLKIGRHCERGSVCRSIDGITREELGGAMGISSTQIAALPAESGFADSMAKLLN